MLCPACSLHTTGGWRIYMFYLSTASSQPVVVCRNMAAICRGGTLNASCASRGGGRGSSRQQPQSRERRGIDHFPSAGVFLFFHGLSSSCPALHPAPASCHGRAENLNIASALTGDYNINFPYYNVKLS